MGRVIKNSDISVYKIDESTGNLLIPKQKSRSLTQVPFFFINIYNFSKKRELNKSSSSKRKDFPIILRKSPKKSKSMHITVEKSKEKNDLVEKMLVTQQKHFKLKEHNFELPPVQERYEKIQKIQKKGIFFIFFVKNQLFI